MYAAAISHRARGELSGINRIFLDLIVREAARNDLEDMKALGLRGDVVRRLVSIPEEGLERIADCPFALCSYGFDDLEAWQTLLRGQVRDAGCSTTSPTVGRPLLEFVVLSLGVVREMAANEAHAASLFFGMPRELAPRFAGLDIGQLPLLATGAGQRLRARLSHHPDFWSELLQACRAGPEARLGAARDLGLQLTLQRALQLTGCRLRDGRLYRRL